MGLKLRGGQVYGPSSDHVAVTDGTGPGKKH